MNIYFLDNDPVQAAKCICDQHITDILGESVALLSYASMRYGGQQPQKRIRDIRVSDAPVRWLLSSRGNFRWLRDHAWAIWFEHWRRFGVKHMCERHLNKLMLDPENMPDIGLTPFEPGTALGHEHLFTIPGDPVATSRKYYAFLLLDSIPVDGIWPEGERPAWVDEIRASVSPQERQEIGRALRCATAANTGTREWASSNINYQIGCEHECRYCYAKAIAIQYGRLTAEDWHTPVLNPRAISKTYRERDGTVMVSSTHDITPLNIDASIAVLEKLLAAGNRVLIVNKPHLDCVKHLCNRLAPYREQILFRFTIGSADDRVLRYWEPDAPAFAERLDSLRHAREQGYETSVSCEPMLDADIDAVVAAVRPYVSQSIWLGKANRLVQLVTMNCPGDRNAIARARELQQTWNDEAVLGLYERYKDDPLIRWKDSIQKVLAQHAKREAVGPMNIANLNGATSEG